MESQDVERFLQENFKLLQENNMLLHTILNRISLFLK